MATLEARLIALAQALGGDVKTLTNSIGVLTSLNTTAKTNLVAALNEALAATATNTNKIGDTGTLTTTAKTSLVAALNEVNAALGSIALIDDLAAASVTDKTYSANKISTLISAAVAGLVASSPLALDTLNELSNALANDPSFAATIATALGNRVRVDAAQTFTALEQAQARTNIGAVGSAELGTIDHDFVADYTAAKV